MWFRKTIFIGLLAVFFQTLLSESYAADVFPKQVKCLIVFEGRLNSLRPIEPSATFTGVNGEVFLSIKAQYELESNKKFPRFQCMSTRCDFYLESSLFKNTPSVEQEIKIHDYLQICTIKDVACLGEKCSFGYMKKEFVDFEWDTQRVSISIGALTKGSENIVLEDFIGEVLMAQQPGYIKDLQNYITKDKKILGILESRRE
jgi:hypothetical protein